MTKVAFLCDTFFHLNTLNLKLQGRDKTLCNLFESLIGFEMKLDLFISDLISQKYLHFPNLKNFATRLDSNKEILQTLILFIEQLKLYFKDGLSDFGVHSDIIVFLLDPFSTLQESKLCSLEKTLQPLTDEGPLQLEIVDFLACQLHKSEFKSRSTENFWPVYLDQQEFPNLWKLAVLILSMFGSTYTFEAAFSTMNIIKSNFRNRLTSENLEFSLRIALRSIMPILSLVLVCCISMTVSKLYHDSCEGRMPYNIQMPNSKYFTSITWGELALRAN